MSIIKRDVHAIYNLPLEVQFCKKCTISNQRPRINFDKNKVIDLGFKKAFFELVYSLIKSSDFKKIDDIRLNEIKNIFENRPKRSKICKILSKTTTT